MKKEKKKGGGLLWIINLSISCQYDHFSKTGTWASPFLKLLLRGALIINKVVKIIKVIDKNDQADLTIILAPGL